MQFKRFNVYGVCFFSMLFKINPAGPLARKSYQMADSFTDLADPKKWTVVAESKKKLSVDQLSKSRFNFSFYVDRPVHVLVSVIFEVSFHKKMLAHFWATLKFLVEQWAKTNVGHKEKTLFLTCRFAFAHELASNTSKFVIYICMTTIDFIEIWKQLQNIDLR